MRAASVTPDLDELWRTFGVERPAGKIVFDDAAPLAGIPKTILGQGPQRD